MGESYLAVDGVEGGVPLSRRTRFNGKRKARRRSDPMPPQKQPTGKMFWVWTFKKEQPNKTKQNKTKQTNKQQIEEEENSCSTNFQSFHRSQVLSPIPFPKQITYIDSPLSLPDYHPHLTLKLQTSPEKIYQLSLGKISQVVWIFRLVLKS